ncbi:NapH/MauN family ferredoxin-type protein [Campylobacter sputorum subsp. bubulus]|uniref:NapH/MauN family ferredoxin-type protein n=1 Tax=Campylobacter sputorum subsp. sputorum TaxID=32024 RepID=A0A381DLC4_9BACT|nr:quinol dehydrogenase ferredoxin subunit NapH [Campylobacter sputorum]ASM36422.1 menaquinol dehydrogenase NapGH, membrane component NapH [Campylobacter sputorum bv. faecalis CCUG 20703]QEL04952.1 menaquinol dehydrogenase NapGH, membrane component NapH [Campylobacter sputorum subsp. sputorum]SUX10059.1 NapH/MauN family ferredoxin-type protein [Campylobacter sputorum subsp. bubulus]SUX11438.1 NapH/MauN family ferredoxin-type protein [Campylobacter sputorum subsp. sputorum]
MIKYGFISKISQIIILIVFIVGNFYGLNVLKGDLSSSVLFNTIPLSDPFAVLQIYLASFSISLNAIIGAFVIFCVYSLIAPRVFCSWVCPVNLITSFAYFIKQKFGINKDTKVLNLSKNLRYFLLILSFVLSFLLGVPAFENISYIGIVQRGIIFLDLSVILWILAIFIFELYISDRGICSHICPLGAFYAIISKFSLIRVHYDMKDCSKCMDCKSVCPEKHVLNMVGKENGYVSSECISCGKCIDICKHNSLKFDIRSLRRK